ncbi:MAG: hypothetical protein RL662_770 [Bacteroidota bacterium]|jgi:outer membrane protein
MLKKIIILFLIVAPIGVYAQEKLAYINTQEIFTQMPEIKDVEAKLATKQEGIKKVLTGMQAEYDSKVKAFTDSKDEPTEAIVMDRQKQLKDIQDRYETYLETSDKEFQELRQQLLTPLQQKMQKAVQDVGAENNFTYILEIGAVPYVSASATDAGKLVKTKLGIK